MKKLYIIAIFFAFIFIFYGCNSPFREKEVDKFTFAFLTDIHLTPERNAPQAFQMVIDTINKLNPEFVITGGDLIMDALGQDYQTADSLYNMYTTMAKEFKMPVYNTMGNHEVFGLYKKSGVDTLHPEYNEKMYENRIGKRYYSFDHKGWHFMILDAVGQTSGRKYIGYIDSAQIEWIKKELMKTYQRTPIAIVVHIPFITTWTQIKFGTLKTPGKRTVINNGKEVLELFDDHNLKLVLQGHLHFIEDLHVEETHFITGGAVSAKWWRGANDGIEEGFMLFKVNDEDFQWEYIDFGWDGEKQKPLD